MDLFIFDCLPYRCRLLIFPEPAALDLWLRFLCLVPVCYSMLPSLKFKSILFRPLQSFVGVFVANSLEVWSSKLNQFFVLRESSSDSMTPSAPLSQTCVKPFIAKDQHCYYTAGAFVQKKLSKGVDGGVNEECFFEFFFFCLKLVGTGSATSWRVVVMLSSRLTC